MSVSGLGHWGTQQPESMSVAESDARLEPHEIAEEGINSPAGCRISVRNLSILPIHSGASFQVKCRPGVLVEMKHLCCDKKINQSAITAITAIVC